MRCAVCVAGLLDSFVAVLPAELEDVPDDFLHQLEGLLDLRLHQRREVNHPHVHLHGKRNPQAPQSMRRKDIEENKQKGSHSGVTCCLGKVKRERENQRRKIKEKEQAENGMTQHSCLMRWFQLPQ